MVLRTNSSENIAVQVTFLMLYSILDVLPPTRNDRPFCDNFVIWGPMKLVSGSNKSLGTYRFDEISTVALGQVLQIEKLIS